MKLDAFGKANVIGLGIAIIPGSHLHFQSVLRRQRLISKESGLRGQIIRNSWCCSAYAAVVLGSSSAADAPKNRMLLILLPMIWGGMMLVITAVRFDTHIDQLAQEGVILDRFYVCPVCSPTRRHFDRSIRYVSLGCHQPDVTPRIAPARITLPRCWRRLVMKNGS